MSQSPPSIAPDDEPGWNVIRRQYTPSPDFINLENGYFGAPAIPVQAALRRYQEQVDRENSYFLRVRFPERLERVMAALAAFTGAGRDELLITRNAMESLNILIQGYPFVAGDAVLLAQHDYDSPIDTFGMVRERKGLELAAVDIPLDPDSDEEIVALYERAITPRTRLVLVTHVVHRTGQVMPVAKIAAMARGRGVDVIADAAHSLAHLDYKVPELGVQFAAFNLHKWVGAPLGTGLLYIARDRIADIAALYGDVGHAPGDIGRLGHFSAVPPAPILAIEDALRFHGSIGTRNKEERLRYLARYWMERVRDVPGVRLYTPRDPRRHGALASFGIAGIAAREVAQRLMDDYRIFTVVRGIGAEECVRVTPHLYTSLDDLDALVVAIRALAG
ncbi:aminotransferase class V-fold PLP-dependent enzyme [Pseudoduganella umbonata]|uniref:Selenocysteine lyase/cysteine desulfurase n=1 Tax=Pseudoduganella umbonata TaxID=864828 RepID=A0A7W5ECM0_9BURK|nr:aminotransferase class V-fold PLP-dependent enzyme [Pseudoduganella umbonata]MBB3222352.1 selenocysteine lyase/cysteine desulfurase [Pseudoduganella umbonata]